MCCDGHEEWELDFAMRESEVCCSSLGCLEGSEQLALFIMREGHLHTEHLAFSSKVNAEGIDGPEYGMADIVEDIIGGAELEF